MKRTARSAFEPDRRLAPQLRPLGPHGCVVYGRVTALLVRSHKLAIAVHSVVSASLSLCCCDAHAALGVETLWRHGGPEKEKGRAVSDFPLYLCGVRFAPGVTRTRGPRIRNPVLYPPELRGQKGISATRLFFPSPVKLCPFVSKSFESAAPSRLSRSVFSASENGPRLAL